MATPELILSLVDRFDRNIDAYRSGNYNETQVRREFIDPMFKSLGWDIDNEKGYAEAYKDVIHEYSLKTKDVKEAPDYCFRIGGTRKFFVEAKKPSVNLRDDIHPSFQLRSYAWSAKLPLSILTDFEEFAVYDTRIPPKKTDKAAAARVLYFTYKDYADRWNELTEIFSREEVLKGSFDKYVESTKRKKGTAEVDEVFLKQMEEWRKLLAKNIALRNPELTIRELNFAVQKTIDRIIFLRICEDRGVEDYGQLMSLRNGTNCYERIKQIYHRADEKYNSGLFHFEVEKDRNELPDELTLNLSIDDKTIKDIIKELYYPDSPYEFSVLPADILGQVYEQFLGKVIRLTPAHHAIIEDKPEVKKAGGVYYTPTYIVDYIVQNTLGKVLESSPFTTGKDTALKKVSQIKILDPACGSGSFLLGAFQYLLDWHIKFYTSSKEKTDNALTKRQPAIYEAGGKEYRLTTAEKKRILLNNIFGVDIDPQAVEVTKLSLLLKVLEGETEETINSQLKIFRERALPDLSNNIKCGNSLIGPDFYDQMEMNFIDEEEKLRINVFAWNNEFKEIMNDNGFDVIIGNPPYGSWFEESAKNYLLNKFALFKEVTDIYLAFSEQAFSLCKSGGLISYIIPSAWTGGPRYLKMRELLLLKSIKKLLLLPFDVFKDAYIDTLVIVVKNSKLEKEDTTETYVYEKKVKLKNINLYDNDYNKIKQSDWQSVDDKKIIFDLNSLKLIDSIRKSNPNQFGDVTQMKRGVLFDKSLLNNSKINNNCHPYFEGDVYRYQINFEANKWLEFNEKLKERPKEFTWFEGNRILLRRLVNRKQRIMAQLVTDTFITNKNLYSVKSNTAQISLETILAIMNSKIISYLYIKQVSQATKDDFPQITIKDFLGLPFPDLKLISNCESQLTKLVKLISKLFIDKKLAKTPNEHTSIERQIQNTDSQIDQLIYQLYGLTEEDIKIVEAVD